MERIWIVSIGQGSTHSHYGPNRITVGSGHGGPTVVTAWFLINYFRDDNTWEEASGIPANLVKKFDSQYGALAPKRTKKEASSADGEATEGDDGDASPKKKPKRKSNPPKAAPKTTDISTIYNRKIINNVLHYEVKFVGVNAKKDVPIFGGYFYIVEQLLKWYF